MDKPYVYYDKRNKPFTEGQLLHDTTYMKNLNSQIHKTKGWVGDCQKMERRGNGELAIHRHKVGHA